VLQSTSILRRTPRRLVQNPEIDENPARFKLTGTNHGYNRGRKQKETRYFPLVNAGIAQLVEQLICNQQVVGSNPTAGSSNLRFRLRVSQADAGSI
jgi:hypothetical protein